MLKGGIEKICCLFIMCIKWDKGQKDIFSKNTNKNTNFLYNMDSKYLLIFIAYYKGTFIN